MVDNYEYQVGASLPPDAPSYVVRKADSDFYHALKAGKYCYVFNSRQMGKSSLKVRVMQRLVNEGVACSSIDVSGQGSKDNVTQEQWYTGIVSKIVKDLQIAKPIEFRRTWWRDRHDISPVQKFDEFIEDVLLSSIPGQIIIFIDEIDSTLSLGFASEDFFALIRSCYNKRSENPAYKRLTFALLGVATPGDLIQDKTRTPFNIGEAIELDGFKIHEIEPLAKGLAGKVGNPQAVMQEVLAWTGGQPFLTQRVCELLGKALSIEKQDFRSVDENQIIELVQEIINNQIIDNWEANDKQEHLKTIRDRLLINEEVSVALLGLYQQILQQKEMTADSGFEQMRLRLTGLVVQQQGKLRVYNQIYGSVFDINWVENELGKLRFYADKLRAWVESNYQDNTCLLRGEDLEKARVWADRRRLSYVDYRFFSASVEAELNQKVVEAETRRNQALQEEEKAKQRLTEVEKNTNHRIRIGLIVLVLSIIGAIAATSQFNSTKSKLNSTNFELRKARESIKILMKQKEEGEKSLEAAKGKQKQAENKAKKADEKFRIASANLKTANQKFTFAQQKFIAANEKAQTAEKKAKNSEQEQQEAEHLAQKAKNELTSAIVSLEEAKKQKQEVQQQLVTAEEKQRQALSELKLAQEATKLEVAGINILRGFEYQQIESLLSSVKMGQNFKVLFGSQILLHNFPSFSPFLALQKIVNNIYEKNQFSPEQGEIKSLSLSFDGKKNATAGSDGTVKIWNKSGQKLSEFKADKGSVYSVIFTPNGQNLVTTGADGIAKLWDLSGNLLAKFSHNQEFIYSISISPNGKIIATASRNGTVTIWNISGRQLRKFEAHQYRLNCLRFSPDGQSIVTAGSDKSSTYQSIRVTVISREIDGKYKELSPNDDARLWNLFGNKLAEFKGHEEAINNVSFSPDGQRLATASDDGTARLWDLSGKQLDATSKSQKVAIKDVSFSQDGKYIATAADDGTVNILTISKEDMSQLRNNKASKETNNQLKGITVNIPAEKRFFQSTKTFKGHKGAVNILSFSPKGEFLVTAGDDGTVRLWAISKDKEFQWEQKSAGQYWVTFSPNGQLLATSGGGGVKIWDLWGRFLTELKHQREIWSVVFSPDGKILVTVGKDGLIRVWNLSGKLLAQWQGHEGRISWVSFSPDGKYIATSSTDSTAKLWDLSGKLLDEFKEHKGEVSAINFSPDGKDLVTVGRDGFVRIWKLSGQEVLKFQKFWEFNSQQGEINSASISPDGKYIATAGRKDTRIWDFSGKQIVVLDQSSIFSSNFVPDGNRSNQGDVFILSFSPDGQFIATGGRGIIQLWHVKGGQLAEYTIPEEAINGISFSPDGKLITAVGSGGTVRVWRLEGLDDLLTRSCHWLKDYFVTRPELRKEICPEQIPELTKVISAKL
ncbi:AAA-like domain-containing protein [Nostoc sp. FACHB-87]|uniref:AAA-like domain-containing protein n=1 Tax=Nostocaceae TaxID=1162 RepID=UPI00168554C9|nr:MULTISPECIES: AAA-like domain-containing protein [Nostocaceae]MBD2458719.1 AAA-like domain-containing protein [Nostoc sp. FACHB-87]MBD2479758.1 AAA-like domain-containing protein [Anabaena sp. FACHB-83]